MGLITFHALPFAGSVTGAQISDDFRQFVCRVDDECLVLDALQLTVDVHQFVGADDLSDCFQSASRCSCSNAVQPYRAKLGSAISMFLVLFDKA